MVGNGDLVCSSRPDGVGGNKSVSEPRDKDSRFGAYWLFGQPFGICDYNVTKGIGNAFCRIAVEITDNGAVEGSVVSYPSARFSLPPPVKH